MHVFTSLISSAIPLELDNVDTDMIIPAQFLTKINREGYGDYLFQGLRAQDPNFVFNDPTFTSSEILVTKANFGCGSSREHAVWALMQAGIRVIIAESYSDIFYNNAAKNSLLTISLSSEIINQLIKKIKQETITFRIDLLSQTIITTANDIIHFDYDAFRKECFLKGQNDLDYLLEATK